MKKRLLKGWEKVVDKGFGNKRNICSWALKEYKDYLYLGTLNFFDGCQIYRTPTGEKNSWEQVNVDGFDEKNKSSGARTILVYKDLLWVLASPSKNGAQIWVTNGEETGENNRIIWKKANIDGFGENNVKGSRAMAVFNDKLYIGGQTKEGAPRILRYEGSTDFDKIQPEKWVWVNKVWQDESYGFTDYSLIGTLLNFKPKAGEESLFAGVYPEAFPLVFKLKKHFDFRIFYKLTKLFYTPNCRIWKYDGKKWVENVKKGFGKPNIMTLTSTTDSNGFMYFGTSNVLGGEIWKSEDGVHWKRIMKRGFRDPFNITIWRIHPFEDRLIVGTQNLFQGCQIWMSTTNNPSSNKDFVQIGKTGMNDKRQFNPLKLKQDGVCTFQKFKGYLYAGTASYMNILLFEKIGQGCEIWRKKID